MFSVGCNYNKLKTNLRLSVNRLKLLEKKKAELAQKARKEIADYIATNKEDRARIRVEHIVREDYLVEAYELLEMYCDLLLARFGLIQQMKSIDEGLEEAINSVLWAAPRLLTDIPEFKVIADQFTAKYGKPYVDACRDNQLGKVSPKLLVKMAVHAPPKVLVERYMMEIAKSHNVTFTPDPNVMREDEVAAAEAMLIDFQNRGAQGYGWTYPPNLQPAGSDASIPPSGIPVQNSAASLGYPGPPINVAPASQPFNYPNLQSSYHQADEIKKMPPGGPPSAPPPSKEFNIDLPDVPSDLGDNRTPPPAYNSNAPSGNKSNTQDDAKDELDFDDLSRRFEELKKKK